MNMIHTLITFLKKNIQYVNLVLIISLGVYVYFSTEHATAVNTTDPLFMTSMTNLDRLAKNIIENKNFPGDMKIESGGLTIGNTTLREDSNGRLQFIVGGKNVLSLPNSETDTPVFRAGGLAITNKNFVPKDDGNYNEYSKKILEVVNKDPDYNKNYVYLGGTDNTLWYWNIRTVVDDTLHMPKHHGHQWAINDDKTASKIVPTSTTPPATSTTPPAAT